MLVHAALCTYHMAEDAVPQALQGSAFGMREIVLHEHISWILLSPRGSALRIQCSVYTAFDPEMPEDAVPRVC